MNEIHIFVSYAHEDSHWVSEDGRKGLIVWLQQRLKRDNVKFWSDQSIRSGDRWSESILDKIDNSQLALLLISEDFAASQFILETELPRIQRQHELGKISVVPILVGGISRRTRDDLRWVLGFQLVPNDQRSLNDCIRHEADWDQVRAQILDEVSHRVQLARRSVSHPLDGPEDKHCRENRANCPDAATPQDPAPKHSSVSLTRLPPGYDECLLKVKESVERETPTVFQTNVVTSLHLLFTLCEAEIAYPSRREIRKLIDSEALCSYLQPRKSPEAESGREGIQTTNDYEAAFVQARKISEDEGASTVTVKHLFNAMTALRPRSVTRYLEHRHITWEQFALVCQPVARGQINSPE